jgi:uncharacterized protein
LALACWGVTEAGNFVDHSHPNPLPKQNVLSMADPKRKLSADEAKQLEAARSKLFEARSKRVRPLRDDKVLASWNGLMLSACARGAVILGDDRLAAAARKNASFVRTHLWDEKTKTLSHRWRDGEKDNAQLLRSYAFYLQGVLDLYQTTLDPAHLGWALELADSMIEKFYDADHGGFFQSIAQPGLILRTKDDYDDAEPSGNSAAIIALLELAAITDRAPLREKAEKSLRLFASKLTDSPLTMPMMLQGAANFAHEPHRVVVAGDSSAADAKKLLAAAFSVYQPNKVVLGRDGPVEAFAKSLPAPNGKVTVYVCTGTFCQPPTSDPAQVKEFLMVKTPSRKTAGQ